MALPQSLPWQVVAAEGKRGGAGAPSGHVMINGQDEKMGSWLLGINDSVMNGRGGGRSRVDSWACGTGRSRAHLRSGVNEGEQEPLIAMGEV